jgi:Fe-S-cluster-containing hydrogenase component 2
MHPEEKYVLICDLCGGDPKCVRHCPEKAVQYLERGKSERPYRSVLVRGLSRRGECDEQ